MATVEELGQRVKAKFPGSYDDLADRDLGMKVKVKFPGSYDDFVDAPQSEANRALAGTGLSVSQPKPPLPNQLAAPAGTNAAGDSTRMNPTEQATFQKEMADRNAATPRMSGMDIVQEAGEQALRSGTAPIAGIPGAAREVGRWVKSGFRPPVLNTMKSVVNGTSNRGPGEIGDTPIEQAQGALVAAGMTARGANNFQAPPSSPPAPPRPSSPTTPSGIVSRVADRGARFLANKAFPGGGVAYDAVKGMLKGEQTPNARRVSPPPQTGSNNRTPLPAPPVTAAPPPVTGFRGAPPETPPVEAGPPPLNWNKPAKPPAAPAKLPNPAGPKRGPELPTKWNTTETAEGGPPTPLAPTPQAGPPVPPAVEPQAGPPQPQAAPESGTAYAAPEGSSPNYTAPKEHYMQAARTVRGKALGRLFRDEGTPLESFSSWKVGDPRWKQAAADAGVTPPNSPESVQAIIDEFGKLPPRKVSGTPRMATGGVIVPVGKEQVRGMAHRWGPKGRKQ